jgi:hypothetical protein
MLGIGINIFKSKHLSSGFSFSDSDAEAYYDALVTANGGDDIDTVAIYSIQLDALKQAIDNFFVALKVDSTYDEINEMYLYIGGDASTHAISGVTATSTLTYTGSPTHAAAGMNLNGTTQYGVLPSTANNYTTTNDSHMAMFVDCTNDKIAMGSRTANGAETWLRSAAGLEWTAHRATATVGYATYAASSAQFSQVIIGSNTGASAVKLYIDGTEVADGGTNSGVIDSTYQPYIGSVNIAGSPNSYTAGDVKFSSIGNGLTAAQVTTLTNAVKTLNTTLGR